ncbi:efflux transporter outer membrane subunit [Maricaulis sp. CAU 1757]
MHKRLLVIATALTTTACASVQPGVGPDSLPAVPVDWATDVGQDTTSPSDIWIAALGDPALDGLVAEAFAANPSLAQALARLEVAQASARIAGADRLPSLNSSAGYTRTERQTGPGSDAFSLGLSASWEADIWGRVADGALAGRLGADAAVADVRATRLSIAGLVAKGWFALTEAQLQTELAERDVATRRQSLDLTERRFARGLVRSSDVRTARSALASSEASLATRISIEAAATRSVEILLGRYPSASLVPAADFPVFGPVGGVGTPADLLTRRPDIQAAERRLEAAGLQASVARKALYPSLSLSGSSGTGGTDIEELFDIDGLVSSLTASLVGPIFNGGALRARRDQAEAQAELQVAAYVSTVLNAWQEAENALLSDALLAQRVDNLQQAFREAAEAEELVVRQYASGVATIFELLTAQSRRISAESQYISARRDRAANRVDLYLATAGDVSVAPPADPAALTGEQ